jgi:hypothetical protein
MSRPTSCSRDFSQECKGCAEYVEENNRLNGLDAALTGWFGFYSGSSYTIKRCKRFNWKSYDRIPSNSR